ncbi:MAG: hypothetical protein U1E77_21045 [Inhella sp.]
MDATSGSDQLYGWRFTVNSAITVTSLGAYDDDRDGMAIRHDIGIYRYSDQTLLASLTLGAGTGGTLDGDFRYEALLSSVGLGAGDYVIVMTMPQLNADRQRIMVDSFSTAPEITWTDSAFDNGSSLAFPSTFGAFVPGMFGPNFLFERDGKVPLPATLSLALLGLGLLARTRRQAA